jgi:hypothetical protein
LAEPVSYKPPSRNPNWNKPGGKRGREHTLGDRHVPPEEVFGALAQVRDPDRHLNELAEPPALDFEALEALGILPPEDNFLPLSIEEFEMKTSAKALPPGYTRLDTGEVVPSLEPRPPEEQQKTNHLELNIKGASFPDLKKSVVEILDALASAHPEASDPQRHAATDGRVNPKAMFALLQAWVHNHGGKLVVTMRVPFGRPVNVTIEDLLELRRREAEANLSIQKPVKHSATKITVKGEKQ